MARPTSYKPEYIKAAIALCEGGATYDDLAQAFEVSVDTIKRWRNQFPEFRTAIKMGKGPADDRVERSLFQCAVGYKTREVHRTIEYRTTVNEDGTTTQDPVVTGERIVEKEVGPDKIACIHWLRNRMPEQWRDNGRLSADDELPDMEMSDKEIAQRMLYLLTKGAEEPDEPKRLN